MAGEADGFVHEITVRWADCDPANIASTGRIPNFALEAIDAWWADRIGLDWYRLNLDRNAGTPFVRLAMEFHAPITPRHTLCCAVRLVRFGRTSMTFVVDGTQDGAICFTGEFVCVAVSAHDFKPAPPPADMLTVLRRLAESD
jgi:4-hydroxybenzoyl-CoA thioesterase